MFFVAALLTILSGLFSAARPREIGSLGVAMCRYAAPFATIRCSCWSLRERAGVRSSACAAALVRKLADFGHDAAMPAICPACRTTRFTAAPGSPGERALAWVAQAPPAASIQSA
jgi:hypothetical protein